MTTVQVRETLTSSVIPPSVSHRSPGITAIYNAVKTSNKNRILDLGPFINSSFSFFSQLGCAFHFEDINESIVRFIESGSNESALGLNDCLAGMKSENTYDVVLLWDVLNFLPLELTVKLFERLKPFVGHDTLFHMVSFVGSSVPSIPCNYSVKNQYDVGIGFNAALAPPVARLTSSSLLKAMPELYVMRSFVNGEGMAQGFSEQILSFQTERNKNRNVVFSNAEMNESSARDLSKNIMSPALMSVIHARDTQSDTSGQASPAESNFLDLGAKVTMNLDAWKQVYDNVYSEDLRVIYSRYVKAPAEQRQAYLDEGHFLHFDENIKFDVIVTWDLLNYFSQPLLYALGRRLVKHAKNGTRLVVMAYAGQELPSKPQSFRVYKNTLSVLQSDAIKRVSRRTPLLNSLAIQKAFPGFFIESSYAFRPGMQKGMNEFVFVYKDQACQDKDRQALYETVAARRKARDEGEQDT